jgi:hypothetical protein
MSSARIRSVGFNERVNPKAARLGAASAGVIEVVPALPNKEKQVRRIKAASKINLLLVNIVSCELLDKVLYKRAICLGITG